jgi:hypothetical protein
MLEGWREVRRRRRKGLVSNIGASVQIIYCKKPVVT